MDFGIEGPLQINIEGTKNNRLIYLFSIILEDGTSVDLTNFPATLTVSDKKNGGSTLFSAESDVDGVVTIEPNSTKDIPAGNYYYDLTVNASTNPFTVCKGNFRLGWRAGES